jgi:hypothetical protein
MGLLNRFFKSQEELAKDVSLKDEDFLRAWNDYHKTVNEKSVLIEFLSSDNYLQTVPKLQKLLALELSDIENEKKTERALIDDLDSIDHYKHIQRVANLHNRLAYAETKYKYIYKLLNMLHNAIVTQMHIVERLPSADDVETLISHLKNQSEVELDVMKQVESRETFHGLFLALVKGEHIVGRMDAKEKQLLKRMELVMQGVLSDERKKGNVYQWADKVFKGVQNQIGEYIARHEEDEVGNNPDVDFEYVNHSEFIDFVKQCAIEVGEKPSEQMITVFVHTFREWYNNR